VTAAVPERPLPEFTPRRYAPQHAAPRTHLLANGNYSVMLTAAGSGYSRWRDIAVTRWREDSTCDAWGSYVFLRVTEGARDLQFDRVAQRERDLHGKVWSAGYQPVGREADHYQASFYEDRAELIRQDGPFVTTTEVIVAPEDDAEVRRVSVANHGTGHHELELTSYSEVVLTSADTDAAHPAFAKMFVQTEFAAPAGALLATRRKREPAEQSLWAAHLCVVEGEALGELQYESDRARFLGRGNDLRTAASIMAARPLSNTTGTVLDPVFALRRRLRLRPGETARVAFWTLLAPGRESALSLAGKYRDPAAFERVKTAARHRAAAQLRELGIDDAQAHGFQRIANRVLYADASLRAAAPMLERNRSGQSALWRYGVSGDLPIVLVRVAATNGLDVVRQLLRAHRYWRVKGLAVDLVILNEEAAADAAELQQRIDAAIENSAAPADQQPAARGRAFALRAEPAAAGSEILQTAARAVFAAGDGCLRDQLARLADAAPDPGTKAAADTRLADSAKLGPDTTSDPDPKSKAAPAPRGRVQPRSEPHTDLPQAAPPLEFFNGIGGFAAAGREYVIVLPAGGRTPAPWVNVIANPQFGCLVSADGAGSTWSLNARENQLTPWSNDPVSDPPSEVIYIRDDDDGALWSATPLPIRQAAAGFVVHHGIGYSRFTHESRGVVLDLLQFVPPADSVKISRLKIVNRSPQTRRLSVTHYADLVLGHQRSRTAPFIVTEVDAATGALFARNPWRAEFQSHIVFLDSLGRQQSCTGDRAEFIGRNGTLSAPAALARAAGLSNRVGAGLDPCGALQTRLTLLPGEGTELVFLLGEAASPAAAAALIEQYRRIDLDGVFNDVAAQWNRTLGALEVKTPDRALDILLNGWLLYQTLASRVWGRTGFYQTSGAYGFRDQLQDAMALCVSRPDLAREHILRAAARQFMAGDVQHWWLPSSGQGVKTRISDNRIWLPFVVAHYLEVTADAAVLEEQVPFLEGPPLTPDQHELFFAPAISETTATLFEHCALALDSSRAVGAHGLPLFGAGDWNDGMNRVGAAGRGESVWLGWFLYCTLERFAAVAAQRGEPAAASAARWRAHAIALQQAIEGQAWDGDWYRRGYFDDGTALGSVTSDECRIDAIAQSWAVISGAGGHSRAAQSMAAVDAQLVSRGDRLVKLFTPPFDRTPHDPGYIKAYPPGLRENGGQYTHAAVWTTLAFALLRDGDRAGELLSLLNPINHALTPAALQRYKVEPYVVCADVYAAESHVGRGGWTWYTGSAGWMYRTAIEGLLGLTVRGDTLWINPCIPRAWPGFEITYRRGSSRYRIAVENPSGVCVGIRRATLDDREIPATGDGTRAAAGATRGLTLTLATDGLEHCVRITLGAAD
jgi:cyclic beta-1,2-glucan synthetase